MDNTGKLPLYSRLSQVILGVLGFFFILYIGQEIIVPVVFAIIVAILLNPVVNYLGSKKINRVVAISITLFFTILLIAALGYFIISQISMFSDSVPQFKNKFNSMVADILKWISSTFNVSQGKIDAWINETKKGVDGMAVLGQALATLKGLLVLFILPVYIFIILYYKPLLLEFIAELFKRGDQGIVSEVLSETKTLIQHYLVGLSIEAAIVTALNAAGLLILGIPYAILLAILGALLNVIPYLGIIIACVFSMFVALATKSGTEALWVLALYVVVQFIDNQYILPRIVASKVKINAFISIIAVLAGGALWGVPGMFLAIPLTAIAKVIFDRVDALKPFGFLLGDTLPANGRSMYRKGVKKSIPKETAR